MELKKFETVKGYPTAFASNKEKGSKEYGLQYLKQMYQDWDSRSLLK